MKRFVFFMFPTVLLLSGCFRDSPEGFDPGGPISRYTVGRWKLVKIVTPSGEKDGSKLAYSEILERGNDQVHDYDKVFRNDSLVTTYLWLRTPAPVSNTSDMTIIVNYDNGMKRFFKFKEGPTLKTEKLETSGYVPEIGSKQDTIRYHYEALR